MMNSNNIVQRRHNSFIMNGRTGWMNISYDYPWFVMNLQTQPPLQLWNKEEEDECHKTRSTIEALTHWKWMSKSTGHKKYQRLPSIDASQR